MTEAKKLRATTAPAVNGPGRGGARAGAGRPNIPAAVNDHSEASEFLTDVMRGMITPNSAQLKAAMTLARIASKPVGKKEGRQAKAAETATSTRLRPSQPPRLVSSNVR